LDFFAGGDTTGAAVLESGRRLILVGNPPEALEVMAELLEGMDGIEWVGFDPTPCQKREQPRPLFSWLAAQHS
jgi:site-specific DNA-methyltransferase (adenine-specific)